MGTLRLNFRIALRMRPEVAGTRWVFSAAAAVLLLIGAVAAMMAARAAIAVEPLRALQRE